MIRVSFPLLLLLAACSAGPAGPPPEGVSRRDYWREQAGGAFACRSRSDLESFLDRIRVLPPRRPRNAGGGSYSVRGGATVYDDLYPLDETYDLYVVWNDREPGKGIRLVEVVGFPDLKPKIKPEYFDVLQAVHRSPTAGNSWSFDPVLLIRAVNAVRSLGAEASPALKAYADLARQLPFEESRKYSVDEYRLFPIVQLHSRAPVPFKLGSSLVANPGVETWPLFPLVLEQDIPFSVVPGYDLAGKPEDVVGRLGSAFSLRSAPLVPAVNPVDAVEALTASPRWAALATAAEPWTPEQMLRGMKELKMLVRRQAIEALAPVYRPSEDEGPRNCCGDPSEADWRRVVEEVRALALRWDPARQDFVRSR